MSPRRLLLALLLAAAPVLDAGAEEPIAPPPDPAVPVASLPVEPAPAPPSRSRFSAKLFAGPSLRQLYGIGFYGADFGVGLGADLGSFGVHGVLEGFAGSTTFGLLTGQFRWGVTFEGRVDRLRFGGGPMFGSMWVRRITRGTSIQDFTFGPTLHLTVDIVRFGEHALYAGARGEIDFLLFATSGNAGTPLMGELTLLLGLRL